MSLTQTLIVLFTGLLVMKPNDILMIIKQIKKIKSYLTNNNQLDNLSEIGQLNFYIQRIISIAGYYDGNYDLVTVKEQYNKLVK